MKNPLETIQGAILSGLVLTAVLSGIAAIIV